MKRMLAVALAGTLIVGTARAGVLVSEREVRREARTQWLEMKRHVPLEPDQRVQRYVQCVADNLIAVLDPKSRDNTEWEVIVFDDDAVNAFTDPNGKIAVFSGLLRIADTPDALATVLGHEISHKTQNHTMERAKKGVRSDMLVIMGSAASGINPALLRDYATISRDLPYAREQETQADLIGLQTMADAGFDPRAAIYLWKNMMNANNGGSPPAILSDHPADDERVDNIVKAMAQALIRYNKAREAGKQPNCSKP
jgi:predicted Zn-dependent protease